MIQKVFFVPRTFHFDFTRFSIHLLNAQNEAEVENLSIENARHNSEYNENPAVQVIDVSIFAADKSDEQLE